MTVEARAARARAESVPGARLPGAQYACEIDGLLVTATANDVRVEGGEQSLVWLSASKTPNARLQLLGWIAALVAVASGVTVRGAHLVGHGGAVELAPPRVAETARAHLTALVAIWRRLRASPLPLFPGLSPKLVADRGADGGADAEPARDPAARVRAAKGAWEGNVNARGDLDDPWVAALFGHLSIEDLADRGEAIVALAEAVFGPLAGAKPPKRGARRSAPGGAGGAGGEGVEA